MCSGTACHLSDIFWAMLPRGARRGAESVEHRSGLREIDSTILASPTYLHTWWGLCIKLPNFPQLDQGLCIQLFLYLKTKVFVSIKVDKHFLNSYHGRALSISMVKKIQSLP